MLTVLASKSQLMLSVILEEIKHFECHIRQLYTKHTYLVDDDSWPPFTPNKFVSLLLIRHLGKHLAMPTNNSSIKISQLETDKGESFTTNDISEIFQHGKDVEAHNKIILILGVPGIGKTILSKEIAYQWAINKLVSEKEIVLMLFLRDPNITKIKVLKDLVHYFYGFSEDTVKVSTVCAKILLQMAGKNVTIILDGLDEVCKDVIDNTYIKLLLDRNALPCCRIVVTSRPVESAKFRTKADTEVEIRGFTKENIINFIKCSLQEDKQKKLIDYLMKNENLYNFCYIPFIISILVCILRECGELPSNRVEVYEKFVIYTISRFLQKFEHSNHTVSNIDQLPKKYKSYLLELSRYAFNTLEIDQVVFTRKAVMKVFPQLANAETWYGLGLLNAVKYFKIAENSDCISYNFLHKSVQEYLASFYITTLSEAEQFNFIKQYFFLEKYLNMWVMYIGLNKDLFSFWHYLSGNRFRIQSKWFGITSISSGILDSKIQCLYLFQCFSELRVTSLCNLVGSLFLFGKLDLSNCTLSLNDINTMMFILDRSAITHWSELNLSHCNIGDTGCRHLFNCLSKLNHKVYFDEIDVDHNMLSLESVQYLVNILVQCKTQRCYATNNIITMDNAKIAYLVMEYAFVAKAFSNPLSIIVNRQERTIFCQSKTETIVKYLKTRYMSSGLYCINCQMNDDVIERLTDTILNNKMRNLYFWNSMISEDYLKRIFSVMPQENQHHFVYVYEGTVEDNYTVTLNYILPTHIFCTCILVSKVSLILYNANYSYVNHLIFANPMLPETNLIQTIFLSECKLNNDTILLLIQLLEQCNNLSTLLLFNNTFNSDNLYQLVYGIKSKNTLRKLVLHQNNVTSSELYQIENCLKEVQSLLINNEVLRGYNCSYEQLKYISPKATSFIALILQHCNINDQEFVSINKIFQQSSCLKEIEITYYVSLIKSSTILQKICNITTLSKLNLRGNNLTEEAGEALTSIIMKNNELKELYLGYNQLQLGVLKIAKGLQKLSSLKVLDLHNNRIPQQVSDELASAISSNILLEKLWLGGNHLGSSTVVVANVLKDISTLKEINLNGNQNRSKELAAEIASIVTNNKALESLLLSNNNLNDDGVIKIAQSLCKHSKLKVFNLQSNNITEEAAEALVFVITRNSGLEKLYLGNNQLHLGFFKIATGLQKISSLKVLDLDDNRIPEQLADKLASVIRSNTSLEKLWLSDNHLGSSTVVVANALKDISTLKEINLNGNQNRSKELAAEIASIVTNNKALESLLLSNNNLNDDGVIKIAQSLCKHSKLKVFNLQSNNITEEVAEALLSVITSNSGLEKLYLGNNQLHLGFLKIAIGLQKISSLKVLDVNNNAIPNQLADELASVIRGNTSLEKLWLGGNHLGSSTIVVANALKDISTLKEINLNGNQNRSKELAAEIASIVTNNKALESLLLRNNNLNDDGVIKIAQSLCKHSKLKEFNLRNNNITEEAAEALLSVITSNNCLENLYLGNNQLQLGFLKIAIGLQKMSSLKVLDVNNNAIPNQLADELASVIRSNTLLEKLWLGDNHLGSSTIVVANALKDISTLKEINLNGNQNRSKELATEIASIVTNNKALESLLLRNNNLNDDGVIKIAQSLCKHSKLKEFNLRNNNITEEAAEALLSVITSNNCLENLYLGNNQLQLGFLKIAIGLQKMSSLKVLDVNNNAIPNQLADELASVIRSNTLLEKLWLGDNHLGSSTIMVANALKDISTLKEINLNGNQNRSKELATEIASIVTNNKALESLLLRDNNLNDDGVIKIAQSLCKHSRLKVFNLQSNNITEEAAEALLSVITSNSGLEKLYLGNNQLHLGFLKIAVGLQKVSSLKVLDLDDNRLPEQIADELAPVIRSNTSLEKLWLGDNHLGSSTIVVANALKDISTLKEINLNGNQNRSKELATEIASIVTNNKALESLLLRNNNLNDDGVIKIAQSLCKHSKLKFLNLQNNNITREAADSISSIMSSNCNIEELYLGNNQLQMRATTLAAGLEHISSLKS